MESQGAKAVRKDMVAFDFRTRNREKINVESRRRREGLETLRKDIGTMEREAMEDKEKAIAEDMARLERNWRQKEREEKLERQKMEKNTRLVESQEAIDFRTRNREQINFDSRRRLEGLETFRKDFERMEREAMEDKEKAIAEDYARLERKYNSD
jgi:hypothetical protein